MSLRDKYTNEEWDELESKLTSKVNNEIESKIASEFKKKNDYEKVFIREDGDGHSYVIPEILNENFGNLLEEDEYKEFDEVYGKFQCSGDPFAEYEFYIKKK